MSDIESKLAALGLTLPTPSAPVANYVPFVVAGDMVFVSGQISKIGDDAVMGRLGEGLSVEDGARAAQLSALNIVAQLKAACTVSNARSARIRARSKVSTQSAATQ